MSDKPTISARGDKPTLSARSDNIGNHDKPTISAMPICWDTAENWKEWQRLNAEAKDNNAKRGDHFCHDCLPEYKARMVTAGRCAHPGVFFVRIIERQFDAVAGARRNVVTAAVRGVRPEDSTNTIARGDTNEATAD